MPQLITPSYAGASQLQSRTTANAQQNRQVGYASTNCSSQINSNLAQPKFGLEPISTFGALLGCCCLAPILLIGGLITAAAVKLRG